MSKKLTESVVEFEKFVGRRLTSKLLTEAVDEKFDYVNDPDIGNGTASQEVRADQVKKPKKIVDEGTDAGEESEGEFEEQQNEGLADTWSAIKQGFGQFWNGNQEDADAEYREKVAAVMRQHRVDMPTARKIVDRQMQQSNQPRPMDALDKLARDYPNSEQKKQDDILIAQARQRTAQVMHQQGVDWSTAHRIVDRQMRQEMQQGRLPEQTGGKATFGTHKKPSHQRWNRG